MEHVKIVTVKHPVGSLLTKAFLLSYRAQAPKALNAIRIGFKLNIPVCLFLELFTYHPIGWAMGQNDSSFESLSFYQPAAWKGKELDSTEQTASGISIKAAADSLGKTIDIMGRSSIEILEQSGVEHHNLSSLLPMSLYREMFFNLTLRELVTLTDCSNEMSFGLQELLQTMLSSFEDYCTNGNSIELSYDGRNVTCIPL